MDLVAPANDHRSVLELPERGVMSAVVVIPVYERTGPLGNVLAGLAVQRTTTPLSVVVVDDGSSEDVEAVVDRWAGGLDVRYLRQERSGRGAGRARNLGAETGAADVVFFLDADCIPDPSYVESHMRYHRRVDNVVASASRRHIDRQVTEADLADFPALLAATGVTAEQGATTVPPDDWRRLFLRRSRNGLLTDAGYRTMLSGLMSVTRSRFEEAGGFDPAFSAWGGEDTELGWRLWNAGAFAVAVPESVVIHQRAVDHLGAEGRRTGRDATMALLADRIPHRFYRKAPSHLYSVPKVSMLWMVDDAAEAERAFRETGRASFTDTEVVLVGSDDAIAPFRSASASRDVAVAGTFAEGVATCRGEIVVCIDGRAGVDHRLVARVVGRLEDPRVGAVRVAYKSGGGRATRLDDLLRIDRDAGRRGAPFFGAVRRRELMKDREALSDPHGAWSASLERSRVDLILTDQVQIPTDALSGGRTGIGPQEARAAGMTELARATRRRLVRRQGPSGRQEPTTRVDRPRIGYVGLAGHDNLGDDAMLAAIRMTMPWADIVIGDDPCDVVMLGGGTLINADGYYLNRVARLDGPDRERIVFGTGVRSPAFWGATERIEAWEPFLASALTVGVRGPRSVEHLRTLGYGGDVDVIGDPALLFERPGDIERNDGSVVVCPLHTRGSCWGGSDETVLTELARVIGRLDAAGREVTVMTAHPADDRWAIALMREAGLPALAHVPGYADLDGALALLAASDLVIGERLHAVVLAAAVDTPFVAVEYRPKLRDFAASIDAEEWCVRTDAIDGLAEVVDARLASPVTHTDRVTELRGSLIAAADGLADLLLAGR